MDRCLRHWQGKRGQIEADGQFSVGSSARSGLPSCIVGQENATVSIASHARIYWASGRFNA